MNSVKFPALAGDSPLAILAAIGTLQLICQSIDDHALLYWDQETRLPVLDSFLKSVDDVAEQLVRIVEAMPTNVVIPGGPAGFPPPGAAPDKLRLEQGKLDGFLRAITTDVSSAEAATVHSWVASLITDLAIDSSGRGAISQFAAPAGKQSMSTMLEKPLESVRSEPDYLRQALVGWRRVPGVTGEYLDHRANWDSSEDGSGKAEMRGVPGATWLALMSYSLWTTTATGSHVRSSGWHSAHEGRRRVQELRLPLWEEPLGPAAVKTLVEHPVLDCEWRDMDWNALRILGIFDVCRAHRRPAIGGKSAGALVPLS